MGNNPPKVRKTTTQRSQAIDGAISALLLVEIQ